MHIEATQTFIKLYKKLPDELKEQTKKAIKLFESNPGHPSLGHKKMTGQKDIYEIRQNAVNNYVNYSGEYVLITSIIDSFLMFCNGKGYVVKDGKVLLKNEEEQRRSS